MGLQKKVREQNDNEDDMRKHNGHYRAYLGWKFEADIPQDEGSYSELYSSGRYQYRSPLTKSEFMCVLVRENGVPEEVVAIADIEPVGHMFKLTRRVHEDWVH